MWTKEKWKKCASETLSQRHEKLNGERENEKKYPERMFHNDKAKEKFLNENENFFVWN